MALYELVQYLDERRYVAPFIEAADQTENLRRAILDAAVLYQPTLEWFRTQSLGYHRLEEATGQRHDHKMVCERPHQILVSMSALEALVEHFELELRGLTWSFELQQSNHEKRSALLLTAVYQQLRRGGFKYAKIAALVPDGLGLLGSKERVRKRVESENACSMVPNDILATIQLQKKRKRKRAKAETTDPPDSSR